MGGNFSDDYFDEISLLSDEERRFSCEFEEMGVRTSIDGNRAQIVRSGGLLEGAEEGSPESSEVGEARLSAGVKLSEVSKKVGRSVKGLALGSSAAAVEGSSRSSTEDDDDGVAAKAQWTQDWEKSRTRLWSYGGLLRLVEYARAGSDPDGGGGGGGGEDGSHFDEHQMDPAVVAAALESSLTEGLSSAAASKKLALVGLNQLSPPASTPEIVKFLAVLFGGFSGLLWIGALLSELAFLLDVANSGTAADLSNAYLGLVLIVVVILTGLYEYAQMRVSGDVLASFSKMAPAWSSVLRDGRWSEIPSTQLVPGDVVRVASGGCIPADLLLVRCEGLKVDNSSLTGEAEPLARSPGCSDPNWRETHNLAFSSTGVMEGSGVGLVVRTGDRTVLGRIAALASATGEVLTPMEREMASFSRLIAGLSLALGGTFLLLLAFYFPLLQALVFAIGLVVANVPQGLTATVTMLKVLTAKRLAERNVLVKDLNSVETLGSTSVICTDKTGTLTINRMTVVEVLSWPGGEDEEVGEDEDEEHTDHAAARRVMAVCSRAVFLPNGEVSGDASESAMARYVGEPALRALREAFPACPGGTVPFNSTLKFQAVLAREVASDDGALWLFFKGAPERVMAFCRLSPDEARGAEAANYAMASQGKRVLGLAHCRLTDEQAAQCGFSPFEERGESALERLSPLLSTEDPALSFVGLVGLIDPPRPTVPGAVRSCQQAGVRVVMVTGDHPVTAKAIGREVGIISNRTFDEQAASLYGADVVDATTLHPSGMTTAVQRVLLGDARAVVVHGAVLAQWDDDELDALLAVPQLVFARTSPQQKLRIVLAFQRRGEVVAVTGDGVNDSPALKRADIGVAMGVTGSEVSKDAANMVLLDDNFASIVLGVHEGRLIFHNCRSSIIYTLSHLVPEIVPFVCFALLAIPLPITAVLILCIDLGTDLLPAISLSYEGPEADIMHRPPRNLKVDRLVRGDLLLYAYAYLGGMQSFAAMYTYFVVMGDYGLTPGNLLGTAGSFFNDETQRFGANSFTLKDRETILRHAQTAYFVAVVEMQWAGILVCKTQRASLFLHGVLNNNVLLASLVFQILFLLFIVYMPGVQIALGTEPIRFVHWFPALFFALMTFLMDEVRKFFIRRGKKII